MRIYTFMDSTRTKLRQECDEEAYPIRMHHNQIKDRRTVQLVITKIKSGEQSYAFSY